MDAVYVCRPGQNEPLRYSLRSLAANVHHDNVWVYGDAPEWVTGLGVFHRPKKSDKYDTVTGHIEAACLEPLVSDPFMLWNDDFYAVEPVGELARLHRGPLSDELTRFARRHDDWCAGLRGAASLLERILDAPEHLLSYELHVPLIVKKTEMHIAIQAIKDDQIGSSHRRTVYGNIARLGGEQIPDPKMVGRAWPSGSWVSSTPPTFKSLALPRLQRLFPVASPYETSI